MLSTEIAY